MRIFFNTDSIGQAFVKPEHVMVFRPFDDGCFIRWDFCLLHHLPGPVTFPKVAKPMRTESYPASFKWISTAHRPTLICNLASLVVLEVVPRTSICKPLCIACFPSSCQGIMIVCGCGGFVVVETGLEIHIILVQNFNSQECGVISRGFREHTAFRGGAPS